MSDSKHTPGPWVTIDFESPHCMGVGYMLSADDLRKVGLDPTESRPMSLLGISVDECAVVMGHANARLIAAAPELLEALQYYMSQFGQALEAHSIPYQASQINADQKARSAIAKAKGIKQ